MATIEELQTQLAALTARVDAITTPPETYYTMQYQGETIDAILTDLLPARAGGSGLPVSQGGTGVTTTQAALVLFGISPRENLLDNPVFKGGGTGFGVFPINQRGQPSYGAGRAFDRWGVNGGTVTLTASGVSWTAAYVLSQLMSAKGINLADGITRTISYVDETKHGYSGILTAAYTTIGDYDFCYSSGTSFYAKSQDGSPAISYIKLEEGENQTLYAENEDGTVTVIPQGITFGKELLNCQQYYQLYRTQSLRPQYAADCRPVMAKDPAQGTIIIGGVTYYYNDAN